jgi:hypothetical protein
MIPTDATLLLYSHRLYSAGRALLDKHEFTNRWLRVTRLRLVCQLRERCISTGKLIRWCTITKGPEIGSAGASNRE